MLRDADFEVVAIALDGAQALALAADARPDVALVDIGLPDLDGFEVARRLLAEPAAPDVVLTSSRDWSDLTGRIAASGACGFLEKDRLDADALNRLLAAGKNAVR